MATGDERLCADLVECSPNRPCLRAARSSSHLFHGPLTSDAGLAQADARLVDEGASVVSDAGDVNADGLADVLVGSPGNDTLELSAGAAFVVTGPFTGDVSLTAADARLLGTAPGEHAGRSVSSAGDVDGDGFDDVMVGADGSNRGGFNAGAAYLLFGPVLGTIELDTAPVRFHGSVGGDHVGESVSGALDVDADGLDDLLVAAHSHTPKGRTDAGVVYLVLGSSL